MTNDQPPEAAVIDLDEARIKLAGPLQSVHSGHCGHYRAKIDSDVRLLQCDKCKAILDPFDFLLSLTRDWDRYFVPLERVKAELKKATARLDDVKRQERNARARLKRVQEKIDALLDAVGQ